MNEGHLQGPGEGYIGHRRSSPTPSRVRCRPSPTTPAPITMSTIVAFCHPPACLRADLSSLARARASPGTTGTLSRSPPGSTWRGSRFVPICSHSLRVRRVRTACDSVKPSSIHQLPLRRRARPSARRREPPLSAIDATLGASEGKNPRGWVCPASGSLGVTVQSLGPQAARAGNGSPRVWAVSRSLR